LPASQWALCPGVFPERLEGSISGLRPDVLEVTKLAPEFIEHWSDKGPYGQEVSAHWPDKGPYSQEVSGHWSDKGPYCQEASEKNRADHEIVLAAMPELRADHEFGRAACLLRAAVERAASRTTARASPSWRTRRRRQRTWRRATSRARR
jgi:hypothetical protein